MKKFADIHSHILCGVDDGAENEEMMYKMLDASYEDGVRVLCLTPHYHPAIYGRNRDKAKAAYKQLCEYAGVKYPDMELYLGNEMRHDVGYMDWLSEGRCRTLNQTKHLLIDFSEYESAQVIIKSLESLLSNGYIPVLAHAERYRNLKGDMSELKELIVRGIIIQVDAQSIFGGWGFSSKIRAKKLLKMRLCDVVASDIHNLSDRKTEMTKCYDYVCKKFGEGYADKIFYKNPASLLDNNK